MGVADADTDEGAVEMLALSHRDRQLVVETGSRLRNLRPGDDITHACEVVVEALRRGDEAHFWVRAGAADSKQKRTVAGSNGHSGVATSRHTSTGMEPAVTSGPGKDPAMGSVAAHRLLNSSSVVSMGISTLLSLWDRLPAAERIHLLTQMGAHAATVDEGLKLLTLGHDGVTSRPTIDSNGSAARPSEMSDT
jgi:hypothetical protein